MTTSKEEKLQECINELVIENKLWQEESKRWRDMYIEYDEMIDKDLAKAKERIASVSSKIKTLDKEINNKY